MNITIVGMGVIGGSYALSLKDKNYNIYGIDINKNNLDKSQESGAIKAGAMYLTEESFEIIAKTDILVLAIYPSSISEFIDKYKSYFKSGLVITDVSGIKNKIVDEIQDKLPKGVDFVFTHPMAGREKSGFEYASEEIFTGANFIIVPTERNDERNITLIENLAKEIGFKNIKYVSIREHDRIIAFTSQLPHAIAVSLINSDNLDIDTGKFTGDSYRELTRIANINELLWSELFLYNSTNLIKMIENFEYQLIKIKKSLKNNDESALKEIFIESTKRREEL
ncbi:MAG: prephenate dehydrogenase [Peptostreptococcaceae bacterium]